MSIRPDRRRRTIVIALAAALLLPGSAAFADAPSPPDLVGPADGATGVPTSTELSVGVSHASGQDLDVTFYGRPRSGGTGAPFTIVALPDTQNYSGNATNMAHFTAQTSWILDRREARNIRAVVHLGDIVNNSNVTEWDRAMTALNPLKREDLAFAVMPGNHDYDSIVFDGSVGSSATLYDQHFPVAPAAASLQSFGYAGGYMGDATDAVTADQTGGFENRGWKNNYVFFEASGMDFIIVSIEFSFPAQTIQWLDAVLAQYPDHRAVLNTHQWLESNGNISTDGPNGGAAAAWNAIKDRCNLFLVLSGHNWNPTGEASRVEQNDCGGDVYMHLSDYQGGTQGGNGFLRVHTFTPVADELLIETYSPSLDQYQTGPTSRFVRPYDMDSAPVDWQVVGTATVAGGVGTATTTWSGLAEGTEYEWYVRAGHGTDVTDTAGSPWTFTTGTGSDPDPDPEPAEPEWIAYIDTNNVNGGSHANAVSMTTAQVTGGSTLGLKDFADGATIPGVTMATSSSSATASSSGSHGVTPTDGDAAAIFGGKVNLEGTYVLGSSASMTQQFTGLDPDRTYTLVATANRDNPSYTNRLTRFALQSAEDFVNESSAGTTANTAGDQVTFATGANTTNGYVARWTGIEPGSDGSITLASQFGTGSSSAAYGAAAIMLALEPDGVAPPAVPGGLDVDVTGPTALAVTWDPVTGATSYDLAVDGDTAAPVAGVSSPHPLAGLPTGVETCVQVRAVGVGGPSAWSSAVCATPGATGEPEWVAFIDTNDTDGGSHANALSLTTAQAQNGSTLALRNIANGATIPGVQLVTTSTGLETSSANGLTPTAGDALAVFGGYVNFEGHYYITSDGSMTSRFTGLDPSRTYTLVASANRDGGTDYDTRLTRFALQSAEDFVNESSAGTSANAAGDQITFSTGRNTNTGYVAKWTGIVPGSDGSITLASQYGTGATPAAYPAAAIMLALESDGGTTPPAVPTGLDVDVTGPTALAVSWDPVAGATSYDLAVDVDTAAPLTGATSPHPLTGLTTGVETCVQVRAVGDGGASAWSAPVCATPRAEPVEPEWIAFVDTNNTNGGSHANALSMTTAQMTSGSTLALKNIADGATIPGVQLVTTASSVTASASGSHGRTPTAGDALAVFGGYVNLEGQYVITSSSTLTSRFTGLDPDRTYTLVASANRDGGTDYDTRLTRFALQSADAFVNQSSVGTSANAAGDQITFATGRNTTTGYVARWTGIVPGSDGSITLASQYGTGATPAAYGVAAIMLALEPGEVGDTVPPVITLLGDAEMTLEVHSAFTDPGATAHDDVDGDLTGSIVVGGTVDTGVVGTYTLTYDVSDAAGNAAAQATRTVHVVDTTPPVITLLGDAELTVEVHSVFTDPGATASDNYDGDLTAAIVVGGTVNTAVVGTYVLTYDVSDAAGNAAAQVTRTVHVVDTTPPVITLIGDATMTVEFGSVFTDPGATASDNYDGDLTDAIVIGGTVDTAVVGTYTLTYDVTDAAGNAAAQVTRTVHVGDTVPPVITLLGDPVMTIEVHSVFTDPGATAFDNRDGDLTDAIVIGGSVDAAAVGTHTLTYDVSDAAGNAAVQVTRAVHVVDTTLPVITLLGDAVMTIEVHSVFTDPGVTAFDNDDGDLTAAIVVGGLVNTAVVGTYTLTYDVTDTAGNAAVQVTRTVHVVDTTSPVITLLGDPVMTIEVGSTFSDPGATALDNYDGDLTDAIVVGGTVDTAMVGAYELTYDVSDAAGNAAVQVTRTVHVVDTTAPVITLLGDPVMTIEVHSTFIDPGATAFDNRDGDLTDAIVVGGTVDTTTVGTYTLTYDVTDAAGNAAVQVARTVHVEDTTPAIPRFPDVPFGHPFWADIEWLAANDIVTGYSDGLFRPGGTVSRQAMAAFLYRLVGEPDFTAPPTASFPDVATSHPFFAEIEWLVAQEIATGYDDGNFRPGATVSRQAMAAFLYRFAGEPGFTAPDQATFSDVPTTHPFFTAIEWLVAQEITTGYDDGEFRPGATVSRQAMAAFLHRFDETVELP